MKVGRNKSRCGCISFKSLTIKKLYQYSIDVDTAAIARILTHLELGAQPPPRASTVRLDLFEAA